MLRRLDLKGSYRSLNQGFWPEALPLGRRSVVYGHNGSGKSSFSELLLAVAKGDAPSELVWEDEAHKKHSIPKGSGGPSGSMAVFTKSWVKENLTQFLDGSRASAIVTLGKEAIESREDEERLAKEIADHEESRRVADKKRKESEAKADKVARGVQDAIDAQLRELDYKRFSKNQYNLPKVKAALMAYKGEFPDENAHADALKKLGEGAGERVAGIGPAPTGLGEHLAGLSSLLVETPTSVALSTLEGHPVRQSWVGGGLPLHEGLDECLFCANPFTSQRRAELARHFDESWLQIKQRATSLLQETTREKTALVSWRANLPDERLVSSDFRAAYSSALTAVSNTVDGRIAALTEVEGVLRVKAEDPSASPVSPDVVALGSPMATAALSQAVAEHNKQVDDHVAVTEGHVTTILDHLIGSKAESYRAADGDMAKAVADARVASDLARLAQKALDETRQKKFSTNEMAETLTNDLTRVYGKNHLTVTITEDGKSYECRRGSEPATHLSDGERTTLSLLYFLRKLEEETTRADRSERVVVIDDPSSSLDREALFATHQWLLETLDGFGQFIVLTHDFGLLRLFINSHKSAWGKSLKNIQEGKADEKAFPKVAFFEMFAATRDGQRQSQVAGLPKMLMTNTSEYAYLFSVVMAGVKDSEDHERLFLLPNAVRRVLEVFTSYKAPHLGSWDQRLKHLTSLNGDAYRDVYDFCNRYSHGEGPETVEVMDARAIHSNIRRCMEFLKSADKEHFEHMCKATGADVSVLA